MLNLFHVNFLVLNFISVLFFHDQFFQDIFFVESFRLIKVYLQPVRFKPRKNPSMEMKRCRKFRVIYKIGWKVSARMHQVNGRPFLRD